MRQVRACGVDTYTLVNACPCCRLNATDSAYRLLQRNTQSARTRHHPTTAAAEQSQTPKQQDLVLPQRQQLDIDINST